MNGMERVWIAPAFIWLATLYFVIGVLMGIGMSMAHNYQLMPSHAHINLLGWVSLALFGCIYKAWPALSTSRLASLHFWTYNLALPPMMLFLIMYRLGNAGIEPALAATSLLATLGTGLFAINVFRNVR